MTKTLLNLYIDADVKARAKAKGINMSRCFNEFLSIEAEVKGDKDTIQSLKQRLAILTSELNKKTEELEKLKLKEKPKFISLGKIEL